MNGETTISYARFMPEQPIDGPWILPSEQFRGENPTPPDDQAQDRNQKTKEQEQYGQDQ